MALAPERLSRFLTFLLRHKPKEHPLAIDSEGFAPWRDVVDLVQQRFYDVTEGQIRALIAGGEKKRFEIRGDKVRALGLCGVATEMPVHPEMLESAKANTLKVQELMTFWSIGNALHKGGMVSPGLWLRREALAVLAGNKPGVIHADLSACNAYKDAVARGGAINCPTVLVLGDGDLMTPAAKAKPLAAAVAGARTVVIPNSGHFMIVERPDEALEALKSGV